VFGKPDVWNVLTPRFQALAKVAAVIFSIMYLRSPTALDRSLLLFASNLYMPLVQLCLPHVAARSESANVNEHKDLARRQSMYTHSFEHISEEVTDRDCVCS
jgi:hypothetical protein